MIFTLFSAPFVSGLLSFVIKRDKVRRALLAFTALAHLLLVSLVSSGPQTVSGWIGADALSQLFLFITSLLFLASSIYTIGYLSSHSQSESQDKRFSREAGFTGCLILFLSMMTLAIISQHISLFWVAIEATTLLSAPLICFQSSARSLEASWKYLLICSVGIAIALIGNIAMAVTCSFGEALKTFPMTFNELARHADLLQKDWLKIAFVFMLIGYGTKMGLAPMHTWLPDAHSESPSSVSALLSGALLNCAFLGILRTNIILNKAGLGDFSAKLLIFFGAASLLMASWFIVQQKDFKRLLAYSSIEHMGILAVAAGAGVNTYFGGMLHAVNHSLTKGMLFMVAGNILNIYKTKSSSDVRGLIRRAPLTGFLWIAGFLSICGVPPFGTFVSEITILTGLGRQHQWLILSLMLASLGVIFVGMSRIVIFMVYGESPLSDEEKGGQRIDYWTILPPLSLFVMILILGLWIPAPLKGLLDQATMILRGY
ncbi:MAG: hypothetical protein B6241_01995 [Spirochaetaceae bacterium 4572_59]|nr:MAG: hypothetical protein B6241_01995 [Spirochaetaceae bacterium 4572_59]